MGILIILNNEATNSYKFKNIFTLTDILLRRLWLINNETGQRPIQIFSSQL